MSRFTNHRTKLDCSLFSQCDSEARACFEECGHCDPGPSDPLVCDGQPPLTFDSSYQHPLGPVCDWPFNTQSSTSVVTGMTVTMEASVEIIIVLVMWQQLCLLTNRQVRLKYYNTITSTKARLFSLKQMKVTLTPLQGSKPILHWDSDRWCWILDIYWRTSNGNGRSQRCIFKPQFIDDW